MGTARTTYHHGDLANALVTAAVSALRTRRAEDLSLRALARELGVSSSAVYRHFADREALLAEVAAESYRGLDAALRAGSGTVRTAADATHRLESMAEAYVSFAHEHPTEFALMFSPRGRAGGGSAGSRAYSALEGAVADLTATGAIREEPRAAPLIWSAVHGLATLSLDGAVGTSLDAIRADARRLSRALVRGLAPEA